MSNTPQIRLDLEDLEQHFLPAWAKESSESNRFAKFEGREGGRPSAGGRPSGRPRGEFRGRPEGGRGREGGPGPRGPRGGGGPGGGRKPWEGRRPDRGARPEVAAEPPEPAVEVNVSLVPEEKGVESIARQIKVTGRAYPVFDIAQLILRKPDRYQVVFSVVKKPDGQVAQPLWICSLDDTLWLSEAEGAAHVLKKHFDLFYKEERKPADPPKGVYTFVAQCGLSGVVLGPPNYHDYLVKLRKLHAERFSRMPFEVYKSRVRIVKDEAVVKKWVEEQSWRSEYVALNVPEPLTLGTREEVERHFREVHQANILRQVERHTLNGATAQQLPSAALRRELRRTWEDQHRFPLKVVTVLSQQFAGHGLHFFKVNKTVTHVAVARPHYLDLEATPVSDGIRKIVEFIHSHPGCTRRQLLEAVVPVPAVPAAAAPAPAAPAGEAPAGGEPAVEPAATAAPAVAPAEAAPSPEQTAVVADLHWLIHQGHVLEFANGRMETAKKPAPKPPKPARPAPAPSAEVAGVEVAAAEPAVSAPVSEESAAPEAQTAPVDTVSGSAEGAGPAAEPAAVAAEPQAEPAAPTAAVPEIPQDPAESTPSVVPPGA